MEVAAHLDNEGVMEKSNYDFAQLTVQVDKLVGLYVIDTSPSAPG